MSDVGTRAVALQEASKLGLGDASAVLDAAKAFDAFLNGGATQTKAAVVSAAGKEPAKPGRKKAATVAATPEPESNPEDDAAAELAETEEDETEGATAEAIPPTLQGAKDAVSLMLDANKRKEAIALLKKFGAASATSVKPKDYAKFIAAAIEIAGPTSDAEDLTA